MTTPIESPVEITGIIAEPVAIDPDTAMIEEARRRAGNLTEGGMFSGRARVSNCPRCGKRFVQFELSERHAAYLAKQRQSAQDEWNATVSENALPLFCIPCERKDMALGFEPKKPNFAAFGYGE